MSSKLNDLTAKTPGAAALVYGVVSPYGAGDDRKIAMTAAGAALLEAADASAQRTALGVGASISLPLCAWVLSTGGNDTTGTVGDPSKPYATMLEAYNDGARCFILGEGTFAGLTIAGDIDVSVFGRGGHDTGITTAKTTITSIRTTTPGGVVKIQDLGVGSCYIESVGSTLAQAADTVAGGSGGTLILTNVYFGSGDLTGQKGGDSDDVSPGASGGSSGTAILIGVVRWNSGFYLLGGDGGDGTGSVAGGSGGSFSAACLDLNGLQNAFGGSLTVDGGPPGADNGSGTGSYGSVDNLTVARMDLNQLDYGSNSGTSGTLTLNNSVVRGTVSGPARTVEAYFSVANTFSNSPTYSGWLSRINGSTI